MHITSISCRAQLIYQKFLRTIWNSFCHGLIQWRRLYKVLTLALPSGHYRPLAILLTFFTFILSLDTLNTSSVNKVKDYSRKLIIASSLKWSLYGSNQLGGGRKWPYTSCSAWSTRSLLVCTLHKCVIIDCVW